MEVVRSVPHWRIWRREHSFFSDSEVEIDVSSRKNSRNVYRNLDHIPDPAILHLKIHFALIYRACTYLCMRMFVTTLFLTVKTWKCSNFITVLPFG